MEINNTFFETANKTIEHILSNIKLFAENSGDENIFDEIVLDVEVLSGMFTLVSMNSISILFLDFKKAFIDNCGEIKALTEIIYDLSLELFNRFQFLVAGKKLNDEQIENFLNTYRPKIEPLITSKRKKEKAEPRTQNVGAGLAPALTTQNTEAQSSSIVDGLSSIDSKPAAIRHQTVGTGHIQDVGTGHRACLKDTQPEPRTKTGTEPVGSEQLAAGNYQLPNHYQPSAISHQPITIPNWDRGQQENFIEIFVEEAKEIVSSLSKDLLELENAPDDIDILNLIFRNMHTLKGNSATIGLQVMNLISHRAENVLDKVRKRKLVLNSEIIDVMLEAADIFAEILNRIVNNENPNIDISKIIYTLDLINAGKELSKEQPQVPTELQNVGTGQPQFQNVGTGHRACPKDTQPEPSRTQSPEPRAKIGTEPPAISHQPSAIMRHDLQTVPQVTLKEWDRDQYENFLEIFVQEAKEIAASLSKDLLELENTPDNKEILNLIFRSMHTLKGNSATIELQVMNLVAHRAENILDKVRKKEMSLNSEMIDVMLESTDIFTEILNRIINNENPNLDISKIIYTLDLINEGKKLSKELPQFQNVGTGQPQFQNVGTGHRACLKDAHPEPRAQTGTEAQRHKGTEPVGSEQLVETGLRPVSTSQLPNYQITKSPNHHQPSATSHQPTADSASNITTPTPVEVKHGRHEDVPTLQTLATPAAVKPTLGQAQCPVPTISVVEKKDSLHPTEVKKKMEMENIKVNISKLDTVMNLVGEIVIAKIRINQKVSNLTEINNLIKSIILLLEGGSSYKETCQIVFEDRMIDQVDKLVLDSDIYNRYTDDINNLKNIIINLKEKLPTSVAYERTSGTENVVEELRRIGNIFKGLRHELSLSVERLSLITNELQESIIQMRMVPISHLFDKVPRMVRTLSKDLNKKVSLELVGEDTELDKTVVEKLADPLMHLLRNSIDHGIESPADRLRKSKSEEGKVTIRAEHRGNQVIIAIEDDGKGINEEIILKKAINSGLINTERASGMQKSDILEMIFLPGFSTAEKVTEVSGRGVGMDVVLSNIRKLKGSVEIDSQVDKGTVMTISLPLTLAIIQVLLIKCSDQTFAVPLTFVEETVRLKLANIMKIGPQTVCNLRDEIISLVQLSDILELKSLEDLDEATCQIIVIKIGEKRIGFVIDSVICQLEIVIKTLGHVLRNVEHVSGATILGEGNVVLILDILGIFATAKKMLAPYQFKKELLTQELSTNKQEETTTRKNILVVDDSNTVRKNISKSLITEGYHVTEAEDGINALEKVKENNFDLFTIDVEMPRMGGYELIKKLRQIPQYSKTPIIMITSKVAKIDKLRALDVGANEYITKPFQKDTLLKLVFKFLGEE